MKSPNVSVSYHVFLVILSCFCVSCKSQAIQNKLSKPKVLNNFVTELVQVEGYCDDSEQELTFINPREGWVFFGIETRVGQNGSILISLESEQQNISGDVIRVNPQSNSSSESMRYLSQGQHTLTIKAKDVNIKNFTIRTIPEIIHGYFPSYIHPSDDIFGKYDWADLKRIKILDNCNVIITGSENAYFMDLWKQQHKKVYLQTPVVACVSEENATQQSIYDYLIHQKGLNDSRFDAAVMDEVYATSPMLEHFDALASALSQIISEGKYNQPYLYIADDSPPYRTGNAKKLKTLIEPLAKAGCYFSFERYLQEKPTEQEAIEFITKALKDEMLDFQSYCPDFATKCIYTLGSISGPRASLNSLTDVNFKVYLDMQFHLLSTDPAFDGLRGIETWKAAYCPEDYLRWISKLFRHYLIDGNTERLTNDPYKLTHIKNGDFDNGLDGWQVESATSDSVKTMSIKDYGFLQGRYPNEDDRGDNFLWTKRNSKKPNLISQEILWYFQQPLNLRI